MLKVFPKINFLYLIYDAGMKGNYTYVNAETHTDDYFKYLLDNVGMKGKLNPYKCSNSFQ